MSISATGEPRHGCPAWLWADIRQLTPAQLGNQARPLLEAALEDRLDPRSRDGLRLVGDALALRERQ